MKAIDSKIQVKLLGVTECLICLLVFGLVPTLVFADARLCPDNQTAELGGPGRILCNLPEDVYEVYWFDNISDSSSYRIRYKPNEGVKSGPGFDRGEYDVQEDGSLIITNVTRWHERLYKVLIFKQSSLQPDTLTISLRVTDARLCPDNQVAELGGPGRILCILPEGFYEVYWFDSISDSSPYRIHYKPNEGVKSGPGFDRGEYDVQEDGSLIIRNVTRWHERMYKLVIFKQSSLQPDTLTISLRVTDARLCPDNHIAELGGPGRILCNLPEDFYEVYWFDSISDSSPYRIRYKPNEGVKSGPGFDRGEYDVQEDGSLIIRNVTIWHERLYKVLIFKQSSLQPDTLTVSLRVTASPNHDSPSIGCQNCYDGYYHRLVEGETLSCSFIAARPPVQLEWFYQSGDGYDHVEMQSFSITENGNGTYNSLATFQSLNSLTHSLVCRATWPTADWRREKEVLVDFSRNESFSDIEPETQYMELNRHTLIPCGGLSSSYMIWKKIIPGDNPELVGFHSHIMTRTITSAVDIEVSAYGSLIFLSVGVHNEGIYACVSGDGLNEEIQLTSVEILILPSPPYINITGCDDVIQRCRLSENTTKVLECAVRGVRPAATLEWIAEDTSQISFFNRSMVSKENNDTFDTILSVEYEVSKDVLCGEEIFVQCYPHEPLSELIEAEATAFILPVSCEENEAADSGFLTSGSLLFIFWAVFSVIRMTHLIFLLWQSWKGNEKPANSRVDIVIKVIAIIFGEVLFLVLLAWFLLSWTAYGLTTWKILFIILTVFWTIILVFRIVIFVWLSCKGNEETAKSRVVSVAWIVLPVLNIIQAVFFLAVLVWFWSLWTAGLTLWEIVLFIFLTVSVVFHMFCKLWMFRLSCKLRNEQTAKSRSVYLADIVNRVIVITSNEVIYLAYSVWFLSFWQASESGLSPSEIALFIFLTVYSVLRTFRVVCLLWLSCKRIKETADSGVAYLAHQVLGVKIILRGVLFLAVSVWFWSLWKESEETVMKVLIMVSLVFQSVSVVFDICIVFLGARPGSVFLRGFYRARIRRRMQNAGIELAIQRLIRSHLEEVKSIHMESMRRTESAPSLSLLNVEGNGQPTEHAERFTLQNAEELVMQRRERRKHKEFMGILEIMLQIEFASESSSLLSVEGNSELEPTENAERFQLRNVEGNGELEPTENAVIVEVHAENGQSIEHAGRLPSQNAEGNGELEPTQNAERLPLLNVEVHAENGQSIEHAGRLPLQNAEGNGELEPTENAERIPLQNVEGNRQSIELC